MPTYVYKAMTKQGQIVRNRITDANKVACIQRLQRNDLVPISLVKALRVEKPEKRKPRNFRRIDPELRRLGTERIRGESQNAKTELYDSFITRLNGGGKVTSRDVRVFTQNFYLLKKARFNNVHALSTVMESTENPRLRLIIEDILYGVESGEYMHTTMEYYSNVFPYIYINLIKVGELSGSLEKSLTQCVKYLDESEALATKLKRILIPNILMMIGIIIMLFVGVIVGVPAMQGLFDTLGTKDELPAITLWFAGVVDNLMEYWYIPTSILVGVTVRYVFICQNAKRKIQF